MEKIRIRRAKMRDGSRKIAVKSPYNIDFVEEARRRNGSFNSTKKEWFFDERDEDYIRELCIKIYGTDGEITAETVNVRVTVNSTWAEWRGGLALYGRQIARAWGRDSGAKSGEGVIWVSGDGADSGGSVKNWRTIIAAGTVIELRDIPKSLVENNNIPDELSVEIISENSIDKDALKAEREKLTARIDEIDKLLDTKSCLVNLKVSK